VCYSDRGQIIGHYTDAQGRTHGFLRSLRGRYISLQDDELRDLFHRMELRLERLDVKVDNLGKEVAGLRTDMRTRFTTIETRSTSLDNRVDNKASNGGVTFWGSALAILIGAAFALTKWL